MSDQITLENDSRQEPMDDVAMCSIEVAIDIQSSQFVDFKDVHLRMVLKYLVDRATSSMHEMRDAKNRVTSILNAQRQFAHVDVEAIDDQLAYYDGLFPHNTWERLRVQNVNRMLIPDAKNYAIELLELIIHIQRNMAIYGIETNQMTRAFSESRVGPDGV